MKRYSYRLNTMRTVFSITCHSDLAGYMFI